MSRAPRILNIGFMTHDVEQKKVFGFQIDLEIDVTPFFKNDSGVYQLQSVVTVEEGILGIMSYAVYLKNTKSEWLKINM